MTSTVLGPGSPATPPVLAAPGDTPGTERATGSWDEPDGVAARGTLVVLTGRGETAATYGRFGRRMAADAYRVRVVEVDLDDLDATRDRVRVLLDDATLPAPRVLVGTDAGATYAALLGRGTGVDGLVLAGIVLPGARSTTTSGPDDEMEARSACPAHRRVLTEDAGFAWGALRRELPHAWSSRPVTGSGLPTLVLHGSADPLTPVEHAVALFRGLPATSIHVVEGGRHDVLNDVTHRSVAATVVLFLERLKLGPALPLIVRDEGGRP